MNMKLKLLALLSTPFLVFALATPAQAQSRHYRHDRGHDRSHDRGHDYSLSAHCSFLLRFTDAHSKSLPALPANREWEPHRNTACQLGLGRIM